MEVASKPDYEEVRRANIRRNEEIMRALGLNHVDFELHEEHNKKSAAATPVKKRKVVDLDDKKEESTLRRSARQQGIKVDVSHSMTELGFEKSTIKSETILRTLSAPVKSHEEEEEQHLRWAGRQGAAAIVGTASYQHTLHRVRSMNEKALGLRIRAIERARGQFAVVKMRLFARVLLLEGMEELAAEATAAYQRLAAVLGEPREEDEAADHDQRPPKSAKPRRRA